MSKLGKITRRGLLAVGGLLGGGLALGVAFAPNRLAIKPSPSDLDTWITVAPDNRITVRVPHCDMGQGSQTALAMMLAEEMDADWAQIVIEEAPGTPHFANGYLIRGFLLGGGAPALLVPAIDAATYGLAEHMTLQITGGSSSVRFTGELGMRVAGASARSMLLRAAAARWDVDRDSCTARAGYIHHEASGRTLSFGALAEAAAHYAPPETPALKTWSDWRLVGSSPARPDIPPKVNGTARYAIDTVLPGMLYATVIGCPVFGGKLVSVDEAAVAGRPGVRQVVRLPAAVAVIADSYWRALQSVQALQPKWEPVGSATVNSAGIMAAQQAVLREGKGKSDVSRGDAAAALKSAPRRIEATYTVPYLAHATMEPPCATARIANGICEVWAGVQDPLTARKVAAAAAGLPADKVVVHNQIVGGGFGRKLGYYLDFVDQSVRLARVAAPAPVKLIWSREEDIRHDYYRTAAIVRFEAGLDGAGHPLALASHYTASAGENAAGVPYRIANLDIRGSEFAAQVPTGPWRSVDHSQHGFFTESFVDELAAAAKADPFAFRRDLLPAASRQRAVLELAAQAAGWGTPLPAGSGRGIALIEAFGSIVAEVAQVSVSAEGAVRVQRVTAAVDCGDLVHPDTAIAQIEGGIVFGLSAALFGEIGISEGRVMQSNFTDYPMAKLADTPAIDVHFVASHAPRGGIGEVGVPALAPAVCNAIFAACGVRVRSLPIRTIALPAQRASL